VKHENKFCEKKGTLNYELSSVKLTVCMQW